MKQISSTEIGETRTIDKTHCMLTFTFSSPFFYKKLTRTIANQFNLETSNVTCGLIDDAIWRPLFSTNYDYRRGFSGDYERGFWEAEAGGLDGLDKAIRRGMHYRVEGFGVHKMMTEFGKPEPRPLRQSDLFKWGSGRNDAQMNGHETKKRLQKKLQCRKKMEESKR